MKLIFMVCRVEGYQNLLKLSCTPMYLPQIKFFQKIEGGLELVSLPNFLHDLQKKVLLLLYSIN